MKRQQLVEIFKDRIIKGDLCRNGCLPTYEELNNQFDASRATLHYVLNQLKHDGYIVSVERQGVFRSDNLPPRSRFALVFESDEENQFWLKLAREAMLISRRDKSRQFEIFHSDNLEHEDSKRLINRLERRMLAGIFFFFRPTKGVTRKVFHDYPEIPTLFCEYYAEPPNIFQAKLDSRSCVNKVMEYAKTQGAKKIGAISKGDQSLRYCVAEAAAEYGLETRPEWNLAAPEKFIEGVVNLVKLLMAQDPDKRPDTLYITDDNLITLVQSTLIEIGVKVPDELKLICHYNFPENTDTVLPVKKIGYDVRDILNKGVDLIKDYYNGCPLRSVTIDGKFDDEIR
jgi:DNA-binding LacI/PurR family transcriptional regulator